MLLIWFLIFIEGTVIFPTLNECCQHFMREFYDVWTFLKTCQTPLSFLSFQQKPYLLQTWGWNKIFPETLPP